MVITISEDFDFNDVEVCIELINFVSFEDQNMILRRVWELHQIDLGDYILPEDHDDSFDEDVEEYTIREEKQFNEKKKNKSIFLEGVGNYLPDCYISSVNDVEYINPYPDEIEIMEVVPETETLVNDQMLIDNLGISAAIPKIQSDISFLPLIASDCSNIVDAPNLRFSLTRIGNADVYECIVDGTKVYYTRWPTAINTSKMVKLRMGRFYLIGDCKLVKLKKISLLIGSSIRRNCVQYHDTRKRERQSTVDQLRNLNIDAERIGDEVNLEESSFPSENRHGEGKKSGEDEECNALDTSCGSSKQSLDRGLTPIMIAEIASRKKK